MGVYFILLSRDRGEWGSCHDLMGFDAARSDHVWSAGWHIQCTPSIQLQAVVQAVVPMDVRT